ncbi:MAG TPA: hypothetical protein VI035_06585 [Solirubrobacterales bacterium]
MTSSKGRRPSPAMIVALAALVVALAGTAMAAPTAIKSILNKKEKKQTKGIARNQVNKLAPGLSVKHADTAGSADTAKRADVSSNTDAIGGVELKDISVAKTANPGGPPCDPSSSTLVNCASVDLNLPHEGRVLLVGRAGQIAFNNAQTQGDCLFRVDGVNSGGAVHVGNQYAIASIPANAPQYANGFSTMVVTDPIPAGAHTFALACSEAVSDVAYTGPQVTAVLLGSGG